MSAYKSESLVNLVNLDTQDVKETGFICDSEKRSYEHTPMFDTSWDKPQDHIYWYALYVKPRSEKKVATRLTNLGFEVCVPTQQVMRQWSDRKKKVEILNTI